MADLSLGTAKKASNQVRATPPADYPGGADKWYVDWFTAGVNAGDPRLLKAAGVYQQAEGDSSVGGKNVEQGYNKDFMNSAPASEWQGKRKPTPSELRRMAQEGHQSEDYARFSDAKLS